jgi:hypothetical protein
MHRLEQADPHRLRDPARIVAVRLVDLLRRQQRLHVPGLHADHRQLGRRQRIDQPLRQRAGLDPDPAVGRAERGQKGDDRVRLARYFLLQDHLADLGQLLNQCGNRRSLLAAHQLGPVPGGADRIGFLDDKPATGFCPVLSVTNCQTERKGQQANHGSGDGADALSLMLTIGLPPGATASESKPGLARPH